MEGEIAKANIGLSAENMKRIVEHVSVVFHAAATVRFDEPLK